MTFKKCGVYRDEGDAGYHVQAVASTSPYRYQTISRSLLDEETARKLRNGQAVEIPFLRPDDLLLKIDS